MKIKSNSYHLEIRTQRKKPYGLLRNSYREDGKVKKQTLCQFTGLSLSQLQLIKASIQGKTVMKEEFKILSSHEYGASFACASILKELGLHKAIHSRSSMEWVKSAIAMIIGRIVFAGSKLALSSCTAFSSLWEVCGITGDINLNTNCYDAMDKLLLRQQSVQQTLAKKHLDNGTIVLYDITSCYMEGEYENSELVSFGYNRDRKRGTEQIVISLLCSKDGCPIAVEVFKGNTKDETTVLYKIKEIGEKYNLEKVIFVGDRGIITQAKYREIDHDLVKVVSALSHSKIKELIEKGAIQISLFDKSNIVEVVDGEIRYMLCHNPAMAKKEGATRQVLLDKTTAELDKIISSKSKTKNSRAIRAGRVVDKYKMAKFIIFEGCDDDITYKLNETKIKAEAELDGCYVVFTDASPNDLNAVETVDTYKSLMHVEQAFRNLKTTTLEIRPVYHKTDDRIKCHVFICMLAYYIVWHMKNRLIPLNEADDTKGNKRYSFDFIIESLKSIRKETVQFMNNQTFTITTPNEEQAKILDLLGVSL
ncbi:MAG: IS1634 family transposase [Defluviitaleaceae bacterium]|nr:IS1634 family transposase [Defluviitaleaceae bacterium]